MNIRATTYRILFPFAKIIWQIFKLNSSGSACVIRNGENILLIRHTYGKPLWSFPGGGIKRNEAPEQTVLREVKEEVGINLESAKFLGSFRSGNNRDTVYVFYAETDSSYLKIDPGEILEAQWFPANNIPHEKMSSVGREIYKIFKTIK